MIEFILTNSKIRLKCDNFETIREHFSVKDETARFRLKGRSRFAAPSRPRFPVQMYPTTCVRLTRHRPVAR